MAVPEWYEETVSRQLAMTPQAWSALESHGIDADTLLQLDFSYDAPSEVDAEVLVSFLRLETDYEVDTDFAGRGAPEDRSWMVVGRTHPTTLSEAVVADWVRWMIAAGAEYGGCRFDGWGAGVPDPG